MKFVEVVNGKKVLRFVDSGVEMNKLPSTERGWRRRKANYPPDGIIPKGQTGWNPNQHGGVSDEPKAE